MNTSVVYWNDTWFANNGGKIKFDTNPLVSRLIKEIDGVTYMGDYQIKSKFIKGILPVQCLSTGCKTALNVVTFPKTIFSVAECGKNAFTAILQQSNGSIFIPEMMFPYPFTNTVRVNINDSAYITRSLVEFMSVTSDYFDSLEGIS
jgi:hypothetical protein